MTGCGCALIAGPPRKRKSSITKVVKNFIKKVLKKKKQNKHK